MRPAPIAIGLLGASLLIASCGGDDAEATRPPTTSAPPSTTTPSTTEPTTTSVPPTTQAPSSETTAGADEGQDTPTINGWGLDVESQPCEASDLPGSPGGEAAVPASWAAGNADYVEFVVDGDLRPANLVRAVAGPGHIQVPCDPALNDGHEITIVAFTGTPGDPGPSTAGETLIVITTATVEGDEGATGRPEITDNTEPGGTS